MSNLSTNFGKYFGGMFANIPVREVAAITMEGGEWEGGEGGSGRGSQKLKIYSRTSFTFHFYRTKLGPRNVSFTKREPIICFYSNSLKSALFILKLNNV
jgi:hypothetical protein